MTNVSMDLFCKCNFCCDFRISVTANGKATDNTFTEKTEDKRLFSLIYFCY